MFKWSREEEQQSKPKQDDISHLLGDDSEEDISLPGDNEKLEPTPNDNPQNTQSEDPDRQGVIREVPNAHLVYKRKTSDNTFEELWIYNIGKQQDELTIRKAILAGTDIPTDKTASPEGDQSYDVWAAGNAELLHIKGLPQ